MAQDQSGLPDREKIDKMISAIIRAILGDDVTTAERGRFMNMDAALSALAYVIAAIGVQGTKAVENRAATKAFVREFLHTVEQNIKIMRERGDTMPLQTGFREDHRH